MCEVNMGYWYEYLGNFASLVLVFYELKVKGKCLYTNLLLC